MLLSKYNRAAGELEGARPASSWIIAIKNVRKDFLTSEARFFVKRKLHKKCGVFEACKKAIGFFDTLRKIPYRSIRDFSDCFCFNLLVHLDETLQVLVASLCILLIALK